MFTQWWRHPSIRIQVHMKYLVVPILSHKCTDQPKCQHSPGSRPMSTFQNEECPSDCLRLVFLVQLVPLYVWQGTLFQIYIQRSYISGRANFPPLLSAYPTALHKQPKLPELQMLAKPTSEELEF